MSLREFFTGAPPRPDWRAQYRRAEGGAWETLGGGAERAVAEDELRAPSVALARGDLLRLRYRDLATEEAWVVTADGPARVRGADTALLAADGDWTTGWEAPGVAGLTLVEVAGRARVGRRRLVLLACACVRPLRALIRPRLLGALDAVEAWARRAAEDRPGPADAASLRALASLDVAPEAPGQDVGAAATRANADTAAQRAVSVPTAADPTLAAEYAARYAQEGLFSAGHDRAKTTVAAAVRAELPVSLLLLAVAGEPWPPSAAG